MNSSNDQLPSFLRTYEDFNDYIRSRFESENNTDKGDFFAKFITKIFPLSSIGDTFKEITLSHNKSRDGGVDLTARSDDLQKILYGQSKLTIRDVADIDGIISKFKNYFETIHKSKKAQLALQMPIENSIINKNSTKVKTSKNKKATTSNLSDDSSISDVYFSIFTLSKVKNSLLKEYEKSQYASKNFYHELKNEGKFFFIDGPDILPLLQSAYRKLHVIPSNLKLNFASDIIKHENVYIGIVSAKELKRCYQEFGDALFFDNIRSFLGYMDGDSGTGMTVNLSIKNTAEDAPEEMLARNNGITFRANKAKLIDDRCVLLEQASIVNGCQTTICIVQSSSDKSCVLAKVVEITDSWAVAKSTNYQNTVKQIVLDIARYMRPQLLNRAAIKAGIAVENTGDSLYGIFDAVYKDRIRYDEVFHLFLGIFSKNPMNIFNKAYNVLRDDALIKLQEKDPYGEDILELLFQLYKSSADGRDKAEETFQNETDKTIFQRFLKEDKADYRSLTAILAACGAVNSNIYSKTNTNSKSSYETIQKFKDDVLFLLLNDPQKFIRYYCYAYEAILTYISHKSEGKEIQEIQRRMQDELRNADITTLYNDICRIGTRSENFSRII